MLPRIARRLLALVKPIMRSAAASAGNKTGSIAGRPCEPKVT